MFDIDIDGGGWWLPQPLSFWNATYFDVDRFPKSVYGLLKLCIGLVVPIATNCRCPHGPRPMQSWFWFILALTRQRRSDTQYNVGIST